MLRVLLIGLFLLPCPLRMTSKVFVILVLIVVFFYGGMSSDSSLSSHLAKSITAFISNFISAIVKWLCSFKQPNAEAAGLSIHFEHGYTVESVFDGSRHGIQPYSVELSPDGDLLVLDSANSNIFDISTTFSHYGRPKLIAGSPEGYSGHVDGLRREAMLNHPKGIALDASGNIYVADTMNMAIRKISDHGVTTIAGGDRRRTGGGVDGPGENARLSNDFDIIYVGRSCSLLVVDRGNRAIREIRLKVHDCPDPNDGSFYLGISMLMGAVFFGYVIALLQCKFRTSSSSKNEFSMSGVPTRSDQRVYRPVRKPLVSSQIETDKLDEGILGSLARLLLNAVSSLAEIAGGMIFGRRRKPALYQKQTHLQQQMMKETSVWPMHKSYMIRDARAPPPCLPKTSSVGNSFSAKHLNGNQFKSNRHSIPVNNSDYHRDLLRRHQPMQKWQPYENHRLSTSKTCNEEDIVGC